MKKYLINILIGLNLMFLSCEDFVEINSPNFQIVNETVFSNELTAQAAMQGIYNELRPSFFTTAISTRLGMSGNLMKPRRASLKYDPFYFHEISSFDGADATDNLKVWSSAYNIIYLTNSLIEGVQNSTELSADLSNSLKGQALVIRAFTYFYLTNIYGDVPLLLSTDYNKNAIAPRTPKDEVCLKIKNDLEDAITLLKSNIFYPGDERFNVTQNVAIALMARVCLYRKDWKNAEIYSSEIIRQTGQYDLLNDLNKVFLRNNIEAIWQIDPKGGSPRIVTGEGMEYKMHPSLFGNIQGEIILTQNFLEIFDPIDKRLLEWVAYYVYSNETYPYINKYKEYTGNINNTESSVVLRLAEQYLIRSEARVHQGKLESAVKDLNAIRGRAGVKLISETNLEITKDVLLDRIMVERKKELFGEYGHHWFDLKRTNLGSNKFKASTSWQDTDLWYPIPEQELLKNPHLRQNKGY